MNRLRRSLGALGYLAFLLTFVEISLQAFYYATSGGFLFARTGLPIYAPNEWSEVFNRPNLAYRHNTNEFEATNYTNGQGFRVPQGAGDYPLHPAPDTTRIMLLGPSFAYGWGVDYESTFGHLLERLLEESGWAGRERVELINAGVPSLGPVAHLDWFRRVGKSFEPDLIIQFVYGSMVVKKPTTSYAVTPEGYLVEPGLSLFRQLQYRAKKSAIVFYSWILYSRIDQLLAGGSGPGDQGAEILGAGREMENQGDFSLGNPAVVESLDYYRALREAAGDAGAEVLVVHFPLSYAVHEEDISRWRHLGVRDVALQRGFDVALCNHLGSNEGVPCLDITAPLRRAAETSDERMYYWLDVHWTEAGNRVAARAVADHLLGSARDSR